jgi:YHS domain-containing protein
MFRVLLYVILLILFVRAMSRFWSGLVEGATGRAPRGRWVPTPSVQMVRDPVCGTFVVPSRAVTLAVGGDRIYFCSSDCRDRYRAGSFKGRTA